MRRVLFLFGLIVIAGLAGVGYILSSIPLPDPDGEDLLQTSFICGLDETTCGPNNSIAQLSAEQDRSLVTFDELPQVAIDAVLSAEDKDFFNHGGVDPVGIARAAWVDIRSGSADQGGSTITQQYVKNAFLTDERSMTRKVKEAVLAVKLERELGKEEILERYLNTIYFGRGAYGIQAASRAYFGVDIDGFGIGGREGIEIARASYLAALIRSPESADVWRDPETAEFRQHSVIEAMVRDEVITVEEGEAAIAIPLTDFVWARQPRTGLGNVKGAAVGTEYLVEYVRQQLVAELGADQVYGGGLRIYTSIDMPTQELAYAAATEILDQPDDPAVSIVSLDEQGRIRAMVGGTDFASSEVNLALGRAGGGSGRQPGSAFKPFVLAEAVKQGYSLRSLFESPSTKTFPQANNGEDWIVSNYGGSSQGTIDLLEATRISSNIAYADLIQLVEPRSVATLAAQMGIETELSAFNSLALGAEEVSVLDMAAGYSTFAHSGLQIDPRIIVRVETADGESLWAEPDEPEQVLTPEEAGMVNYAMSQVVERGTGRGAQISTPAAGKTGTTQDNRDAWFVGHSCDVTTAVWVGYPGEPGTEPRVMDNVRGDSVTGGSFPATIWSRFMGEVTSGRDCAGFPEPDYTGIVYQSELRSAPAPIECDDTAIDGVMVDEDGEPFSCTSPLVCDETAVDGVMVGESGTETPCVAPTTPDFCPEAGAEGEATTTTLEGATPCVPAPPEGCTAEQDAAGICPQSPTTTEAAPPSTSADVTSPPTTAEPRPTTTANAPTTTVVTEAPTTSAPTTTAPAEEAAGGATPVIEPAPVQAQGAAPTSATTVAPAA